MPYFYENKARYTAKKQGNSTNDLIFSSIFLSSICLWHGVIFENIEN